MTTNEISPAVLLSFERLCTAYESGFSQNARESVRVVLKEIGHEIGREEIAAAANAYRHRAVSRLVDFASSRSFIKSLQSFLFASILLKICEGSDDEFHSNMESMIDDQHDAPE